MLFLFMWDMKVEIIVGRMYNLLMQFMYFFFVRKLFLYLKELLKKVVYCLNEYYIVYFICLELMGGGRVQYFSLQGVEGRGV